MNGVKKAMEAYLGTGIPTPKKTYNKPEQIVETGILRRCLELNLDLIKVDSSNRYSHISGRFTSKPTSETGISDLLGNNILSGKSAYVEVKSPGRRSGLKDNQRRFLIRKIMQNCFAVVTDSFENLSIQHMRYNSLKTVKEKKDYLLDALPKKRTQKESSKELF